jgi:hypothetical protein
MDEKVSGKHGWKENEEETNEKKGTVYTQVEPNRGER